MGWTGVRRDAPPRPVIDRPTHSDANVATLRSTAAPEHRRRSLRRSFMRVPAPLTGDARALAHEVTSQCCKTDAVPGYSAGYSTRATGAKSLPHHQLFESPAVKTYMEMQFLTEKIRSIFLHVAHIPSTSS